MTKSYRLHNCHILSLLVHAADDDEALDMEVWFVVGDVCRIIPSLASCSMIETIWIRLYT